MDEWVESLCEGLGKIDMRLGKTICEIGRGKVELDKNKIVIRTDTSEIETAKTQIKRCDVFDGKSKRFGYCVNRQGGGIIVQIDRDTKEMLAQASMGPIISQLAITQFASDDLQQ